MYGSVEVPLIGIKPEEKESSVSKNGSGRSLPEFFEDLDPRDKQFWQEVSCNMQ